MSRSRVRRTLRSVISRMPIIRPILESAGSVVIQLGALVAALYTRLWPALSTSWFDHRFDHLRGPRNWYRAERGILANRIIRPGAIVLDLCCGDGCYSGLFWSTRAQAVDALDSDERAIVAARRRCARSNVRFLVADVTAEPFPRPQYDIVCFFEAIEHFSPEEGTRLVQEIAQSLSANGGTLIGSTPIVQSRGGHNFEHDNEFTATELVEQFLRPHFLEVDLWCSDWPERTVCYFQCRKPIILPSNKLTQVIEGYVRRVEANYPFVAQAG